MKPELDRPGMEDDEGCGVLVIAHFRRRPQRDAHGNAHGEMAGARFDRASRSMSPSVHPYLYNATSSPTMLEATGQRWRLGPEQPGLSMGAELLPSKPDRGPRSGSNEPADITDHAFLTTGTAPTPHNPLSAAGELHKAAYEESSGHEDASLRPEPRPGGRVKKASKQTVPDIGRATSRQLVETAAVAFDAADWRPRPPTLAQKMAGR